MLVLPPANRKKADRATLEALGEALWDTSRNLSVVVGDDCQFTEIGLKVIDTGVYGNGSTDRITCGWDNTRPNSPNARVNLVIDEELGFVVTNGMVPGKVYPYYDNISTFIPDSMTANQRAQEVWIEEVKTQGNVSLLFTTEASVRLA